MEIYMTTGARCFPQFGPFVVPGAVWSKRLPTAPSGALRPRAGRLHRPLVHLTCSDLPVFDRMGMSAAEP